MASQGGHCSQGPWHWCRAWHLSLGCSSGNQPALGVLPSMWATWHWRGDSCSRAPGCSGGLLSCRGAGSPPTRLPPAA
ncbi:hypothetical protein MC885_019945, partial [Smutsia gigantea]